MGRITETLLCKVLQKQFGGLLYKPSSTQFASCSQRAEHNEGRPGHLRRASFASREPREDRGARNTVSPLKDTVPTKQFDRKDRELEQVEGRYFVNTKAAYPPIQQLLRVSEVSSCILQELQYLNLALNNLTRVQNLEGCESLEKLDLTVNFIDKAGLNSLRALRSNKQLRELFLTGNPCTEWQGYRQYVIALLPQLQRLDGKHATPSERIQALQAYPLFEAEVLKAAQEAQVKGRFVSPFGSSQATAVLTSWCCRHRTVGQLTPRQANYKKLVISVRMASYDDPGAQQHGC